MPKLLIFNPPSSGANLAPLTADGDKVDLTTTYDGADPALNINTESPTVLKLTYTFNGTVYYPTHVHCVNTAYGTQGWLGTGNVNGISFGSFAPAYWGFNTAASGGVSSAQFASGTGVLAEPILQINTGYAGQVGQIIKLAATPTANAFEVQPNGSTVPLLLIDNDGALRLKNFRVYGNSSSDTGASNYGTVDFDDPNSSLIFNASGDNFLSCDFSRDVIAINSGKQLGFSSSASVISGIDVGFSRVAAGQIKLTNGGSGAGCLRLQEMSDPSAPPANHGITYMRDNGAGKTQYVVRFPTGAVQVIATEP